MFCFFLILPKYLLFNVFELSISHSAVLILLQMESLAYRKMYFEEFCAAAISTHQLEALEGWEQIASTAFEHFEQEGNRVISIEELARVCKFYFKVNTVPLFSKGSVLVYDSDSSMFL